MFQKRNERQGKRKEDVVLIKLQDTIIQSDTQSVLNMLKFDLAQQGVARFHIFRNNGENIQTNCPFHKNGQERNPSFGVNGEIDKCHCFACGWSGTIEEMISELYGYQDEGKFGKKWLIKRFSTVEIETRPNILEGFNGRRNRNYGFNNNIKLDNDINRFKQHIQGDSPPKQYFGEITEEELDKYRYIHPYMYERGLTDEIIERFDIGYDRERKEITFPVRDLEGRCVFIAGRSVERKFFRLPKGLDKPVYQAYRFNSGKYRTAYITESFLNCLTAWKYNQPAMALIGTGNKYQYDILNNLPAREYILAFDPDEAGRRATERFKKNVRNKIIREVQYQEPDKDINDLQEDFFRLPIIF